MIMREILVLEKQIVKRKNEIIYIRRKTT